MQSRYSLRSLAEFAGRNDQAMWLAIDKSIKARSFCPSEKKQLETVSTTGGGVEIAGRTNERPRTDQAERLQAGELDFSAGHLLPNRLTSVGQHIVQLLSLQRSAYGRREGQSYRFYRNAEGGITLVQAVHEGFAVKQSQRLLVTPGKIEVRCLYEL